MFRQTTQISTTVEALDELYDMQDTLAGTATLALALAQSGMHEPKAIKLVANLIDYCAFTTKASYKIIYSDIYDCDN